MTGKIFRITVVVVVPLTEKDIEEADDDLQQAAQNLLGHTGAQVVSVEEGYA